MRNVCKDFSIFNGKPVADGTAQEFFRADSGLKAYEIFLLLRVIDGNFNILRAEHQAAIPCLETAGSIFYRDWKAIVGNK